MFGVGSWDVVRALCGADAELNVIIPDNERELLELVGK